MPRKRVVEKREMSPDGVYNSPLVTKFINCLMWDGKRSVAEKTFYEAIERMKKKVKEDPLKVFKQAVENTEPRVEVRSRRVGGATYQVPVDVNRYRQTSLAIRWLIQYTRSRGEKSMSEKLAAELLEAAQGRGNAIKKRDDVHRMAEANRAFSHYRW